MYNIWFLPWQQKQCVIKPLAIIKHLKYIDKIEEDCFIPLFSRTSKFGTIIVLSYFEFN